LPLLPLSTVTIWVRPTPKLKPAAGDSVALYRAMPNSVQGSLRYQTVPLTLLGGIGELMVPAGYRYLNAAQRRRVLTRYWHTPGGTNLGVLFPKDKGPLNELGGAYIIQHNTMGCAKDDDANNIDYSDLLADMQKDLEKGNTEREKAGYEPARLLGWGENSYYDKSRHVLH